MRQHAYVAAALLPTLALVSVARAEEDPDELLRKVQEAVARAKKAAEEARQRALKATLEMARENREERREKGWRIGWSCDADARHFAALDGWSRLELWLDGDEKRDAVIETGFEFGAETFFHPTLPRVYVSGDGGCIRIFDIVRERRIDEIPAPASKDALPPLYFSPAVVQFAPNGAYEVALSRSAESAAVQTADRKTRVALPESVRFSDARFTGPRSLLVESMDALRLYALPEPGSAGTASVTWSLARGSLIALDAAQRKAAAKSKPPLGWGYLSWTVFHDRKLVVTATGKDDDVNERPFLAGWDAETGKQVFRTSLAAEMAVLDTPAADFIVLAGQVGREEVLEVRSLTNGQRSRVVRLAKDALYRGLLLPDATAVVTCNADAELERSDAVTPTSSTGPGGGR